MTDIITYETLYDMLRKEKNSVELQKIGPFFHQNLVKYLKEKKDILTSQEKKDSVFTTTEVQKTRKQIENIQKIIKELYEKRESKIILLSKMNSRSQSPKYDKSLMLDVEKELYNSITNTLDKFRNDILYNIVNGNSVTSNEILPKDLKKGEKVKIITKEVKFNKKTDRFVGTDLNNYGPFERGDIGKLPAEIAELLIEKKQVEEIEHENTKE